MFDLSDNDDQECTLLLKLLYQNMHVYSGMLVHVFITFSMNNDQA